MSPTAIRTTNRRLHLALRAAALTAMVGSVFAPALAFASVGKVAVVEGKATRTAKGEAAVTLTPGAEIELNDVIAVEKGGNLKLSLNDESVLMVGGGSQLTIEEGRFESLEHRSFVAKLGFGKVWAHVSKALSGSDAKFEVKTERAVAGVRGTIFRVDTQRLLAATKPTAPHTRVKVAEGKVAVEAKVKKGPELAEATTGTTGAVKKAHVQIAGPKQISKDEWEKRFTELQAHQEVEIGEELFKTASYDPAAEDDAFSKFVKKNQ